MRSALKKMNGWIVENANFSRGNVQVIVKYTIKVIILPQNRPEVMEKIQPRNEKSDIHTKTIARHNKSLIK